MNQVETDVTADVTAGATLEIKVTVVGVDIGTSSVFTFIYF